MSRIDAKEKYAEGPREIDANMYIQTNSVSSSVCLKSLKHTESQGDFDDDDDDDVKFCQTAHDLRISPLSRYLHFSNGSKRDD